MHQLQAVAETFEATRSRGLLVLATMALLLLYGVASLWPFVWEAPRLVTNGAELLPGGGVRFATPGIALAKRPPQWVRDAIRSNRLEVALRVRSSSPAQSGPARILTLSRSPRDSNLMIGQKRADLVVRLRTPETDAIGEIDDHPIARVPELFRTADWVDLRIVVEPGNLRIFVDGEQKVRHALPLDALSSWDPSHRLALGNEVTYNRPWLGEIARAGVRAGELRADYADAGELVLPAAFAMVAKFPKLVPWRPLNLHDDVLNVVFYLPLGLLLGAWRRDRGWRSALCLVLIVAATSAGMETLQMLLPRREPSVDDLIFNTAGGALGIALAAQLRARLGRG
ncbi:MAG: VanZ family protein [Geminicoccales bacterium]